MPLDAPKIADNLAKVFDEHRLRHCPNQQEIEQLVRRMGYDTVQIPAKVLLLDNEERYLSAYLPFYSIASNGDVAAVLENGKQTQRDLAEQIASQQPDIVLLDHGLETWDFRGHEIYKAMDPKPKLTYGHSLKPHDALEDFQSVGVEKVLFKPDPTHTDDVILPNVRHCISTIESDLQSLKS